MEDIVVGVVCGGLLIALLYLLLIEAPAAARRGERALYVRLLGAITPGAYPFSQKKVIDDDKDALAELAMYALAGLAAYKALEATFSFLKGIDWSALTASERQVVNGFQQDIERYGSCRDRLDRADALLAGDSIEVEQAALLASATMETTLRQIQKRHRVALSPEQSEGAVGIATALRDRSVITQDEYRKTRHFITSVRNNIMHGEFHAITADDTRAEVEFVRGMTERYDIR